MDTTPAQTARPMAATCFPPFRALAASAAGNATRPAHSSPRIQTNSLFGCDDGGSQCGGLHLSVVKEHYDGFDLFYNVTLFYAISYYSRLDELNELYTEDEKLMEGITKPSEKKKSMDRLLANLSIGLNLTLLFTNLVASVLSGSLAIVSTFVDSLMDVTSGLIIGICLKMIKNTNSFNYPRGRNRLELVGVIICSILMGIANTLLVMESIRSILEGNINPVMDVPTLSIMLGGSAIKIFLCLVCYRRGTSSSVVLAMDMRNDIATSIVAIVCATIGDRYWSYADPIGAIVVCGVIATSWYGHALEHVPHLVGRRAESEHLSRILKIVIEHDPRIKYVDHVMVYHTTLEALAEVHIVMDEQLPLRVTHDIAQGLEQKLMMLDFVERSFVHCDYECDGDK